MNVALVLYELARHSYIRGEVWGEEIDALSIRKAFLRRLEVHRCDILTINSISTLEAFGVLPRYDLAIHYFEPSLLLAGAVNVLQFQQFYDLRSHDLNSLQRTFDVVTTPARAIANAHRQIHYLPLAVDPDLFTYDPVDADEYSSDLLFIGNAHIREVDTYRYHLTPPHGARLAIHGSRWNEPAYAEWLAYWRGVLPVEAGRHAYSGTKIALGIHNQFYLKELDFVTARPFHALACSCCMVSDTNAALQQLLPATSCGLQHASTAAAYRQTVADLLRDSDRRNRLQELGRPFILGSHTWDHRVDELLALLQ